MSKLLKKEVIKPVSINDLKKLFFHEEVSFDALVELLSGEFGLEIDTKELDTRQKLLDFVYDFYLKEIEKFSLSVERIFPSKTQKPKKGTAKGFIVSTLMSRKTMPYKELYDLVWEKFYPKNKPPKVRVKNVIKELILNEVIKMSSDKIITVINEVPHEPLSFFDSVEIRVSKNRESE